MTPRAGALSPGASLGAYRIEEMIGYGSSAIVYRGIRETDGATVALKVFRADLSADPAFRKRFDHEVRAACEVEHRHLVPVVGQGEEGGRLYLAMRFGGAPLSDRLAAGPLPVDEAIRVAVHTASGLDALHRHGLVHRDVKPANILVDADGVAALGDFGLSKGSSYTELTRAGQVIGTVDYLAPELVRGEKATAASDLYALGCVTYEVLTGRPPFADGSALRVGVAHLEDDPVAPRVRRPELPAALSDLVLGALAKDPARRPRSAVAFAHMLDVARRVPRP
jgi:serine/threonine-protein kinase